MKALNFEALALTLTLAAPAVAQMDMTEIASKVSKARQENAQRTRDYSWTQRTEVSTEHDGSDVKLMTDHETTPDGLDYVACTTIVVPDKGVEMMVENFSYQREK